MHVAKCEKANNIGRGKLYLWSKISNMKLNKTLPRKFQMLTSDTNDLAVLSMYLKALLICPKLSITATFVPYSTNDEINNSNMPMLKSACKMVWSSPFLGLLLNMFAKQEIFASSTLGSTISNSFMITSFEVFSTFFSMFHSKNSFLTTINIGKDKHKTYQSGTLI